MAKKFITYKDEDQVLKLCFGNVDYHENLLEQLSKTIKRDDVLGGGWFYIDRELKIIILYGISVDFGSFQLNSTEEELLESCKQSSFFFPFIEYTLYFSKKIKLEEIELDLLNDPKWIVN